jgi:hypothetical protein
LLLFSKEEHWTNGTAKEKDIASKADAAPRPLESQPDYTGYLFELRPTVETASSLRSLRLLPWTPGEPQKLARIVSFLIGHQDGF